MESEREQEPQPLFFFKDKFGSFEISRELKQFCDDLENAHPNISGVIDTYLVIMDSVACVQKAEYMSKSKQETPSQNEIENYQRNLKLFLHRRSQISQQCGAENLHKLDLYLGVDSVGLEAGDARPLLGVDKEVVKNLAHYLHKERGHDGINMEN